MAETVAVMLGDGFEPVEVVAPVDVLRRGGVEVTLVSVMERKEVTSAQDIKMVADALVENVDLDLFTMVVLAVRLVLRTSANATSLQRACATA